MDESEQHVCEEVYKMNVFRYESSQSYLTHSIKEYSSIILLL